MRSCTEHRVRGEALKVKHEADSGSDFVSWEVIKGIAPGTCGAVAPQCSVISVGGVTIKATFEATGSPLTIEVEGEGEVSATEPPEPVSGEISGCEAAAGECSAGYGEGAEVPLTATPASGWHFVGWSTEAGSEEGTCTGTEESCTTAALTEALTLKAVFAPNPQPLMIEVEGEGEVSAGEPPAPLTGEISGCEQTGGECEAEYGEGAEVPLTATAVEGWRFLEWETVEGNAGSCEGEEASCEAGPLAGPTKLKAIFVELNINVHIVIEGAGSGKVVGVVPLEGIPPVACEWNGETEEQTGACDVEASESFGIEGIKVKHEAGTGSVFAGWTVVEGSATSCGEMNATCAAAFPPITIKATFEPTFPLAVEVEGPGEVDAEEPPAPLSGEIAGCEEAGGECEAEYAGSETVTLAATPGEHAHFVEWTGSGAGSCSGESTPTCAVEMAEAKSVKAVFAYNTHELTVDPTGEGSVDGGPISGCEAGGGTCSGTVDEGSTVTLTASPGAHKETVWTSGCTSSAGNTCEVEIPAGDATVEVEFVQITHELTVNPTGEGSVDGGPISGCEAGGGTCSGTVDEGSTVTLTASPGAHKETVWTSGCTSSAGNTCEVEIPAGDATVEVEFVQITHTLAITLGGSGAGVVECSIEGGGFGSCAGPIDEGSSVEVKATAAAHSTFDGFSAGSGSASACGMSPCSFSLEEDSALTATFTQITHTLTVGTAGDGSGSVSCNGGPCASSYPEGATVTLAATAASGTSFAGWSGGGCSGTGSCVVTIDADTAVTATFEATPPPPPPPPPSGGGSTPPPAETCLNNAALCKPGLLIANPAALVQGNKALLKVRCRGEQGARCRGVAKLFAKVRSHGKSKTILVGKTKYNLPTNSTVRTLRAKLTHAGLKLVRRAGRRGLTVKLAGKEMKTRVVKLKRGGGKKHKRYGRRHGRH